MEPIGYKMGPDRLSRNVGTKLPQLCAVTQRSAVLNVLFRNVRTYWQDHTASHSTWVVFLTDCFVQFNILSF